MSGFSPILMEHFQSPRNAGRMPEPDVVGEANVDGHAPYMTLQLRIRAGSIAEAKFLSFGCGVAIAAGSALTELITGRSLEVCRQLTAADIDAALGSIPAHKRHCAQLAVDALRSAVRQMGIETLSDDDVREDGAPP